MTPEERQRQRDYLARYRAIMTPEQRQRQRESQARHLASWSSKRREAEKAKQRDRHASLTPQQRRNRRVRQADYHARRYRIDPAFRLAHLSRGRLYAALRGRVKRGSAVKLLGCSPEDLVRWLGAHMRVGMSWDNFGRDGWEVDHVRPLSGFDLEDPAQLRAACHVSNLQPLFTSENRSKGAGDVPGIRKRVDLTERVHGLDYHGCTAEELVRWLQVQTRGRGWTWENYGVAWRVAGAGHFSNLRPAALRGQKPMRATRPDERAQS